MTTIEVRYLEWDFDNDTVVEYEREGECCECGGCCMVRISWRSEPHPLPGWNGRNGNLEATRQGVVTEIMINGHRRFFDNVAIDDQPDKCTMLTDDKRCKAHTGKMLISRAWPMSPRHVTPFPECSYTFREIGRWKISELEAVPS